MSDQQERAGEGGDGHDGPGNPIVARAFAVGRSAFDRVAPFGDYENIYRLRRGGMSEVLEAWDKVRSRRVVLKRLDAAHARTGALLVEAGCLQTLAERPGVAGFYGLDKHDGDTFLVLEHVGHFSLEDWMADGARERRRAA